MPAVEVLRPQQQEAKRVFVTPKAFLLMKVKRGNNIGCISIPLERAPTPTQAKEIITGILGTTDEGMYVSKQSNLFFQATPGLYTGLNRLFDVSQRVLGIDMASKRHEFETHTAEQFFDSVNGRSFEHAGVGKGGETFPFGYKIENGYVVGKTLKGEKRRVVTLAKDEEHTGLLTFEDETFVHGPDEITSVEISEHPTVITCCALFFKQKFLEKLEAMKNATQEALEELLTLYIGPEYALEVIRNREKNQVCGQCQKTKDECGGHS